MEITVKFIPDSRAEWRRWLLGNHDKTHEIWLSPVNMTYLDSVEEALCFGWIDGIAKRDSEGKFFQRFTPRRKNSNWTQLNLARVKRLIRIGLMHESGLRIIPEEQPFVVPQHILRRIDQKPEVRKNFNSFPELYIRVRISNIMEFKEGSEVFESRISTFLQKTAENKMYGNWNDGGKLP